jgi:uncharacterized membrane protein
MKLNPLESTFVGGLLAVVNFLQLEQGGLSHTLHIVIGCVSVLLGTILIKPEQKTGL